MRPIARLLSLIFAPLLLAGCDGSTPTLFPTVSTATTQATQCGPFPPSGPAVPGGSRGIGAFQMVNATTGWGTINGFGAAVSIRRTMDGGAMWQEASPPGLPNTAITLPFFLGTADVWFAMPVNRETARIFHSEDGGATWQCSAPIQFGGYIYRSQMTFADRQHGWLLADYGVVGKAQAVAIFNTEDGGMHWVGRSLTVAAPTQSTEESLPYDCIKTGMTFHDALNGWIAGECLSGEFLYVTHTGGWTWQRLPLDSLDSSVPTMGGVVYTGAPRFSSVTNGVFLARSIAARIYLSRDGGATWSARVLPAIPDSGLDFINADDGWFTVGGTLYATHDGGRGWDTITPTIDSTAIPGPAASLTYAALSFVDTKVGFAGERGTFPALLKTTDGGHTWVRMRF